MMQCSKSRKEAARLTPLLTPRTLVRLATWNIRTMYETGKTVQVAREMKRCKIGVLGLSETRQGGYSQDSSDSHPESSCCTQDTSRRVPPILRVWP